MSARKMKYWSMVALAALGLLAVPGGVRADTLTDWYNWSGTQSLDHDRTVTRFIAIGYGNPATLNHTAGTLYHSYTGDWFVIGNNVAGTYNMSGNAAVNAADGTGRFRLGNEGGQGTMTMTDNATATVGSLEFGGFFGDNTLLLSGNAAVSAAGLDISHVADYISFASGCAATLTVTGKVLSDYQAWVSTGHIRVDGVKQANFNEFKVVGNTLSLVLPPTKLAFGVQPGNLGATGLPITPAVTVLIQDAAGNTVTTGAGSVTISSGTTAFTPGSVLTVNAVNGVATFAAIAPTTNGTHTLTASSGSLTPATSSPFLVGPETLTDWYNWSGTQSLDHDRTVTRYIAIGYGNPATLNHTAGTLYHSYTGDWFVIGNNVAGTYNMSGNAAVNAADGTERFRLGNAGGGQGTMTMTDNATATVGPLEFGGFGADTLLLSGSASMQATGLVISGTADYISFASGCAATLTVTGKVLSDYQAWVSTGHIRVDGVIQANFSEFKVVGNTLSLVPPPTKLAFGVQPSNPGMGSAGLPITPAVTVLIQDAAGNTVTNGASSVTISSGTTAFTPGSVLTVNAVNGVATFAAIAPTTDGTHTLTASSGSLTPATSNPFPVGPDTLTDWYNWSGTQSLNHDRTVTRFIAIGYGNPATLNHTAGTLYHSYTGDWFVVGNNVAGTYHMSGNAAVNAADGTERFRLGNAAGGQGTMTMTDNATATVGALEFWGAGSDTLLLSGSASMHATGLVISSLADYISFASGCAATLTVTGKVLSDYQAWVSTGHIRVDGVKQANFSEFKVVGNTLSLVPPPTKLAFGVQPSNPGMGSAGLPITPAVTVLVQDAAGNTVTNGASSVTISSGTTAFTPGSVLTVNAVNGVATFAAIAPTTDGTHTLTASSGSLTPATSNPFPVGPETLTDWYNWSGTQSLNHDRTVTRFIAIGYKNPATLNHTAGTLYHSYTGDWFVVGNNVAGTYNMSGNAAVNAADGTERFRLGNEGGRGTMTMTDNATATVGSLEFGGFFGDNTLLLSGNAAVNAAGLDISHVADYISFASGCAATLTVTGKVLSDYQAWVSAGHIRVDGAVQANFNEFKVAGNTLSLATGAANNYAGWLAANPEAAGQAADQDHDNDGVPNGVECFLGGTASTTGFTHLPGVVNTAGTRSVTWTKGSGYSGTYGTDYVVEVSDTLQNWANAPTDHVTESPASVKYTFPVGVKQFARLKVVVP
jgi:hypothetical protein